MKLKLPRYTSRDYMVLGLIIVPATLMMNSVIFGVQYFRDWTTFLFATPYTALAFSIDFIMCGGIAVLLKRRLPREEQVGTRLTLMILTFLLITGLFLLSLFRGFEAVTFLHYTFEQSNFVWAYISLGILNIFLTFLHEGIARYESWKSNLKETESLKKLYRQSRLSGLKSQVNPHFLFNSLNTLSFLIQDDEEKGEKFLDEMTRVYRYMLQNDEEQFVTLETELKFIQSYLYLLQARHGEGLRIIVDISEEDKRQCLPPLALQAVVENIVSQNMISKEEPLDISIYTEADGAIAIANNVQPRLVPDSAEVSSGLENLVKKYELLNQPPVVILGNNRERIIRLPLICKSEVAV